MKQETEKEQPFKSTETPFLDRLSQLNTWSLTQIYLGKEKQQNCFQRL